MLLGRAFWPRLDETSPCSRKEPNRKSIGSDESIKSETSRDEDSAAKFSQCHQLSVQLSRFAINSHMQSQHFPPLQEKHKKSVFVTTARACLLRLLRGDEDRRSGAGCCWSCTTEGMQGAVNASSVSRSFLVGVPTSTLGKSPKVCNPAGSFLPILFKCV